MSVCIRMRRELRKLIDADLERTHPFAAERVGFVLARWSAAPWGGVLMPYEYLKVADELYVPNRAAGATIGSTAIRAALQSAYDARAACLHVHAHGEWMPYFGSLDLEEQEKLVPSFRALIPDMPHGALLLFGRGARARVWLPDSDTAQDATRVTTIGAPLEIFGDAS